MKSASSAGIEIHDECPARRARKAVQLDHDGEPAARHQPRTPHPKWGTKKGTITPDHVGEKLHLRVELQKLFRLPRSNALVFPIRCYLISFNELVTDAKWASGLHRVIRDLPVELATG